MITELNPPALIAEAEKLTPMIRRAADALAQAVTIADVHDAKRKASAAYDAATVIERHLRAAAEQVELIAEYRQAIGEALKLEFAAMVRIADECDAAQGRGELATQAHGGANIPHGVPNENTVLKTLTDIGLKRKLVHEARIVRDAEQAEPGIVVKTIDEKLKAGGAPIRTDVQRATKRIVDREKAKTAPKQTAPHWQPPASSQRASASVPTGKFDLPKNADGTITPSAEDYYNLLAAYHEARAECHDARAECHGERAERLELEIKYDDLLAEQDALLEEQDDDDDENVRLQRLIDAEDAAEQRALQFEETIKACGEGTDDERVVEVIMSCEKHVAYFEARVARLNAEYAIRCSEADAEQQKEMWLDRFVTMNKQVKELEERNERLEATIKKMKRG